MTITKMEKLSIDTQSIKRILVTRMQGLGDAICFLPALRALRENFPEAKIKVLCGRPAGKEILEYCSFIDEIIFYDVDKKRSLVDKMLFLINLRRQGFDLILSSTYEVGFALKAFLIGARYRIGFRRYLSVGKIARDYFWFLNNVSLVADCNEHEVDANLKLIEVLNLKIKERAPYLLIKEPDKLFVEGLFREYGLIDKPAIVIHPSSNNEHRNWPLENYAKLITYILKNYRIKIVLIGNKEHNALNKQLFDLVDSGVINFGGKTTLGQLIEVIRRCHLFIGNDSGPAHIAAAVRVPIVVLFGPGDCKQLKPYADNCIVVSKHLACSPCEQHKCSLARCMQLISVNDVIDASRNFLDKMAIAKTEI